MFTLDASKTLNGKADSATSISYTITGLELAGTTEVYKVLAQGQLASSVGLLYTVPVSKTAFIKQIFLANTTSNSIGGIKLYIGGTGAANQIINLTIPPNGSAKFDSTGWQVYDFLGIEVRDNTLTTLYEEASSTIAYLGKALPGVLSSEALWRISKIDTSSGIITTFADGNSNFDNIWDNRAALSYS